MSLMVLQSLVFEKEKFTKESATEWLKTYKFNHNTVTETDDFFRFRQMSPFDFDENTFRAVKIKSGITSVMGKLKKGTSTEEWIARTSNANEAYQASAIIRKVKDKWVLYSHKGKRLGVFSSKDAAMRRERQINYFKHIK